jgi:hypothetical protein
MPFTRTYVMGQADLLGIKGSETMTLKVPKMCSYNILIK